MLGQTIAVFFVLLLLAATLWLLRRRGLATVSAVVAKRLSKQKLMQVVERVPLTANHSLHLVRIQDRVILIGVSPSGCQQIDSFAAPLSPVSVQEGQ
jgi:flagellar biosynthetic protein FliO